MANSVPYVLGAVLKVKIDHMIQERCQKHGVLSASTVMVLLIS
jgi:hypothetical protein